MDKEGILSIRYLLYYNWQNKSNHMIGRLAKLFLSIKMNERLLKWSFDNDIVDCVSYIRQSLYTVNFLTSKDVFVNSIHHLQSLLKMDLAW